MSIHGSLPEADRQQLEEFKQEARITWAVGDYDGMARVEGLYETGQRLVGRVGVARGDEVLDVACGTGNATIPAAQTGAEVVGLDLTAAMVE